MKTIAVIGDSHAWGAGATGYQNQATSDAPLEPTSRWFMPFTIPSFVNILRNEINSRTDSLAKEMCAVTKLPYRCKTAAEAVRFQLFAEENNARFSLLVNGEHMADYCVRAGCEPKEFITVTVKCSGLTEIELIGDAKLFRMEEYSGEYAVVNCGFPGSTAEQYLAEHFSNTIVPLEPDYIIVEPCTINDWLLGKTDEQYYRTACQLLKKANEMAKTIMVTDSPICGEQTSPMVKGNPEYEWYVHRSVEAAERFQVPIADAHKVMLDRLNGLSDEEKFSRMFSDAWHPNDLGHQIYADAILNVLGQYL